MSIFDSPILGGIELTNERKLHIITVHPEFKNHLTKFIQVLKNPDEIRRSRFDKTDAIRAGEKYEAEKKYS